MAEVYQDKKVYSLLEISNSLKNVINSSFPHAFWIKAEMIKLNYYSHSGHCYPDIAEKENGKVLAQTRATLWKSDYLSINNRFLKILKEPLKDGIKILFLARINYDPVYGLSLRILDIDPSFTLGDIEREKAEAIQRLQKEGLFDKNKKLSLPLLPKRIAVISVETSKGYADFMKVLHTNPYGYYFITELFPSLLQGEKAIGSIKSQLKAIEKKLNHFDVVAIIRGGGGDVGLSCYNDYSLAAAVAAFPLPVITGIGHATNETVVEMIAFENAITPTKIAEHLIQCFHNFARPVEEAKRIILERSTQMMKDANLQLRVASKIFKAESRQILMKNDSLIKKSVFSLYNLSVYHLNDQKQTIHQLPFNINKLGIRFLENQKRLSETLSKALSDEAVKMLKENNLQVEGFQKTINILNPQNLLKKGYSLTLKNGKVIKDRNEIKEGDQLETILANGTIQSVVIKN